MASAEEISERYRIWAEKDKDLIELASKIFVRWAASQVDSDGALDDLEEIVNRSAETSLTMALAFLAARDTHLLETYGDTHTTHAEGTS